MARETERARVTLRVRARAKGEGEGEGEGEVRAPACGPAAASGWAAAACEVAQPWAEPLPVGCHPA